MKVKLVRRGRYPRGRKTSAIEPPQSKEIYAIEAFRTGRRARGALRDDGSWRLAIVGLGAGAWAGAGICARIL